MYIDCYKSRFDSASPINPNIDYRFVVSSFITWIIKLLCVCVTLWRSYLLSVYLRVLWDLVMWTTRFIQKWYLICLLTSRLNLVRFFRDFIIACEALQNLGLFSSYGCWTGRDLYRAKPAVTQGLVFSGLIRIFTCIRYDLYMRCEWGAKISLFKICTLSCPYVGSPES